MWFLKGTKRHKSSLPERRKNKDVKISHYLRVASVRCELVYWEKVSHGNCVPRSQPWMTDTMDTKSPGEGLENGTEKKKLCNKK